MGFAAKHPITKSFQFALEGLLIGIQKGRNFRIQVSLGILAIILGFYVNLNYTEWAILTITVACVIILELLNTAIESIVDIVSPERRIEAKIAKDVAAASVLVASIGSILVAIFLFLPKL